MEHVICANCRFILPDIKASERHWTAYQCGNSKSEYYRSLLNISIDGIKLKRVAWPGCEHGAEGWDSI